MKVTMLDHVIVLMVAVAVVVAAAETDVIIQPTIPAETSTEETTYLELEEENERQETSNEVIKMIEQNEDRETDILTITEERETQEIGDRVINMVERSERNETNDEAAKNMIVGRPEVVTVLPDNHKWRKMDRTDRKGRRRSHNSRRKHRGRRRKWKNRRAKKYYRRNRTYEWGARKHRKSGDMQAGHWQHSSPNQREYLTVFTVHGVLVKGVLCDCGIQHYLELRERCFMGFNTFFITIHVFIYV